MNSFASLHMKRKRFKLLLLLVGSFAFAYVASYVGIRLVRPECINTKDGAIAAFRRFYYPLRYIDSERPAWYLKAQDDWLEVKLDWINVGNGYLYFLWDGREQRAGYDSDHGFKEGDSVLVHFNYVLVTLDDFRSRIIPFVDKIKASNKAG